MNKDLNMKVNVLPVLTYGFLKVNDSTVSESDIKRDSFETPDASKMPQGVNVKSGVDYAEAGEIFIKNKDRRIVMENNGLRKEIKLPGMIAMAAGGGFGLAGLALPRGFAQGVLQVGIGVVGLDEVHHVLGGEGRHQRLGLQAVRTERERPRNW